MSSPLVLRAPAKINLSLEVLAKRPDGYHEVRMLMAGVSLVDELSFEPAESLSLSCDRPDMDCSKSNLILRAAGALQQALGRNPGARIHLTKRIPVGGGLAGGSTDAAATLKGLNALWQGGLDKAQLSSIAAGLGSDIPFCLSSGWAYATGRGEHLEALAMPRRFHFVLANPGFEVSTQWVYSHVPPPLPASHNVSQAVFEALQREDIPALEQAARNDLEAVTAGRYPEIGRLERALRSQGALVSRMSGSGPTVWGLFQNAEMAEKACEVIRKAHPIALAVQTLSEPLD